MIACPWPVAFSNIKMGGDLARRAHKNFDRLEEERYQPAQVFQIPNNEWPGDTEGRTILALSLLTQALHREPKYLAEILERIPAHTNVRGYFGAISPEGVINEQQLSSHGWVLRGLCEEFLRTKNTAVEKVIREIVRNLVLPTAGHHRSYPIDPAGRTHTGSHSGNTSNVLDGWALSSDIGCDFIFLDGVVQAWEVLGGDELKAIIDEIIHRFFELDLIQIKAQTHATLTCLRAILRYAMASDQPVLIPEIEQRYQLYREQAWTENFANYNWFGRPEWTEPCAVVDSFMVVVGLWQMTRKPEYLADAHLIYFNALGHGQRWNEGFGCDTCVGAAGPFLEISVLEAFWCCTMRGGEGLARAVEYAYFVQGDQVFVPFFYESEVTLPTVGGRLRLKQTTAYPLRGEIRFEVVEKTGDNMSLHLFCPPWATHPKIAVNGKAQAADVRQGFLEITGELKSGDVIEYRFDLILAEVALVKRSSLPGYRTLRHGPLLLGCESAAEMIGAEMPKAISDDARYRLPSGIILAPINDMIDRGQLDQETYRRQVLFETGASSS